MDNKEIYRNFKVGLASFLAILFDFDQFFHLRLITFGAAGVLLNSKEFGGDMWLEKGPNEAHAYFLRSKRLQLFYWLICSVQGDED